MNARWKPAGEKPELSSPLHTRQGWWTSFLFRYTKEQTHRKFLIIPALPLYDESEKVHHIFSLCIISSSVRRQTRLAKWMATLTFGIDAGQGQQCQEASHPVRSLKQLNHFVLWCYSKLWLLPSWNAGLWAVLSILCPPDASNTSGQRWNSWVCIS